MISSGSVVLRQNPDNPRSAVELNNNRKINGCF